MRLYFLIIVVSLSSSYCYTQNNDSLVPDFSLGFATDRILYNEVLLNDLSDVFDDINPLGVFYLNFVGSVKRYNFLWRRGWFHHRFKEGVETVSSYSQLDSLVSRESVFNFGYRVLQTKRIYLQPNIQINFSDYKLIEHNTADEIESFKSISYGFGTDLGLSLFTTRTNRNNNVFFDVGTALQLRYMFSEGYPILNSNINNNIFVFNILFYGTGGNWELFNREKKREKI